MKGISAGHYSQQGADVNNEGQGYACRDAAKVMGETQDGVHCLKEHVGALF